MTDDQAYYWSGDWQENERIAAAQLAAGEGVEFNNARDAVFWLSQTPAAEGGLAVTHRKEPLPKGWYHLWQMPIYRPEMPHPPLPPQP